MAQPNEIEVDGIGTIVESPNGFCYNAETGEYVGKVGEEYTWDIGDDLGRAEWVLERMGIEESEIAALERRKKMLIANIDSMVGDHRRVLDGLKRRFEEPLRVFALNRLLQSATVTKTVKTAFGQLSFRSSKGTNEILDMDAAVQFANAYCPSAIKTTVNVSDLLEVARGAEGMGVDISWLKRSGPKEEFNIKTGIS